MDLALVVLCERRCGSFRLPRGVARSRPGVPSTCSRTALGPAAACPAMRFPICPTTPTASSSACRLVWTRYSVPWSTRKPRVTPSLRSR